MDEDEFGNSEVPDWQSEPMSMNRQVRRTELDKARRAMDARRPGRIASPARSSAVGYPQPFRRNPRKIGFHRP